jgi:sulfate permease, SulP family
VAGLRRLLPRRGDYDGLRSAWRGDVVAGLTVAVVALPLALGFGVASGVGPRAGLVTAIVAGLVAALLGGSNLQVSGPTGAMTVVLLPIVAREGAGAVALVGVLAGMLVVAAGVAGVGRYLAFVPWPVIEGFTVGIAVIIFLQQVPAALDVARPDGENTALVAVRALARFAPSGGASALAVVGLVIVVMVVTPRIHRALPASLVAVVAGTAVARIGGFDVARIGELPSSLPVPGLPALSLSAAHGLLGPAVAVAALAAIESLLSARVADGMSDAPRHDPDRELFGQGVANIASALFGGMPATGAIARTAVNVRAGARTRVAAATHAVALIGVVLVGSRAISEIPLAALAAVLMVTAVRMVERHNVRAVTGATRSDAAVFVVTAAATVVFDLIVAVEIGLVAAGLLALRSVARTATASATPVAVEVDADEEQRLLADRIVTYRLDGALFFGAAQRFLTELTAVTDARVVILRLPEVQVLDATGAHALREIVRQLEARHITVLLKGVRAEHERVLRAVGAFDELAHHSHSFTNLDDAVAHARLHLARAS